MEQGSTRAGRRSRARVRRVARLRRWLLAGVVLLIAVLAGLLGYARYRAHRFIADLPKRLGIDIKSETNGFTLSQSSKGHTLFTLHAAKAIQRENGKATLHDVAITLYGSQGSTRTDSIRGEEFEYDQPNGVVRAAGEVHLDLAAPAPSGAPAKPNAKRIMVTTRGLTLLQKLGVAATDQPLEVMYGDLHGGATGADYESDTGVLRLRADVHLDGVQSGDRVHLDAAAAELDRNSRIATLHHAHVSANGSQSSGDRMVVALGKSGGIQQVNAEGNVNLANAMGMHAAAPRLQANVSDTGRLQTANMSGGARLQQSSDVASAATVLLHFNAAGKPESADLQRAVRIDTESQSNGTKQTLTAARVVAQLLQNGKRTELRDAVASGGAELQSTEGGSAPGRATRTTVVAADTLHATTALAEGERYVNVVDGTGKTKLDQRDSAGNLRTSSGDTLHLVLLPHPASAKASSSGAVQSALQTGNVVVTQHTVAPEKADAPAGQPQDSRATAARAAYDSATDRLVLTGSPVITAPGVQLAAERIDLLQVTDDAEADGSVKGTLVQSGSAEAVHVIAAHATVAGASGTVRFFGGDRQVRMWNSAAQLQSPEVLLDRSKGTLLAHAAMNSKATSQLLLPASAIGSQASGTRQGSGDVMVTGDELLMTAATAQAPGKVEISGGVRIADALSDLRAKHAVATLKPAGGKPSSATPAVSTGAFSGGSIQSILATGDVRLRQPGRTGTGERLLYTESDHRYELTGTNAAPPTMADSLRGTITGTTLIFHGADDSVEVAGETGRRVRTETHAARPARSR